jgi:hypothetical protein
MLWAKKLRYLEKRIQRQMLTLPDNPTPEQLQAIALTTIRETFESDASKLQNLEPLGDSGWKAQYDANGQTFNIEYQNDEFTKWPVGAEVG